MYRTFIGHLTYDGMNKIVQIDLYKITLSQQSLILELFADNVLKCNDTKSILLPQCTHAWHMLQVSIATSLQL